MNDKADLREQHQRESAGDREEADIAERAGAPRALLIPTAEALDWPALEGVATLGITAGASAPESLVDALIERLRNRYAISAEERTVTREDVVFKLPALLS